MNGNPSLFDFDFALVLIMLSDKPAKARMHARWLFTSILPHSLIILCDRLYGKSSIRTLDYTDGHISLHLFIAQAVTDNGRVLNEPDPRDPVWRVSRLAERGSRIPAAAGPVTVPGTGSRPPSEGAFLLRPNPIFTPIARKCGGGKNKGRDDRRAVWIDESRVKFNMVSNWEAPYTRLVLSTATTGWKKRPKLENCNHAAWRRVL